MANRLPPPTKPLRVIPTKNPVIAWLQGSYPGVKVEK